jgi:ABC-type transport system substrate-binding protein
LKFLDKRWRGLAVVVAVLIVAGLVLAACGSSGGGSSASPTSQGTPKAGGTYNFPVGSDPISIEPLNNQEVESTFVTHQLFEGLYKFAAVDGVWQSVPNLCTGPAEANADGTQFTFHLKQGIKFGPPVNREVTAQDFVDSWNWVADAKNQSDVTYIFDPIQGIDPNTGYAGKNGLTGLSAPDKYTFVVKTRYPYFSFPLSTVHTAMYVEPVDYIKQIGKKAFAEKPVGTGPFVCQEWKHDQSITIVKNPDYWDPANAAYVDKVYYPIITSTDTEWLEFQKGTIDYSNVPSGQVRKAQTMPQVKSGEWTAKAWPDNSVYFVNFVMNKPMFSGADKLPVREAMNMTADRDAVINIVKEGVGIPSDALVPVGMVGYKAGINPYPYDPEKGKQVMADYVAKNGAMPTIPYWYNTGVDHDKVAEVLIAGWQKYLGLKFKLNGLDASAYWPSLGENKAPGVFRLGWATDYPGLDNWIYLWTTEGGKYGSYSFYSNPQVDELWRSARGMSDTTQATNTYAEAQKIIQTDAPCVPIYTYQDFRVTNNRIGGFDYSPYTTVDMWKVWVK